MSWRTAKLTVTLRSLGRALGLNRIVTSLIAGAGYEDRFQSSMLNAVLPGDVVWDVGANVGLYSLQFAQRVGDGGKVVAYEPSPINLTKLREAVESVGNVMVMPIGLGARDEEMAFEQGEDDLGATSRFVGKLESASESQAVIKVKSGDDLVGSGAVPVPNVIKIDTEGFELDVLAGMRALLENKHLRTICIEVHFGLLEERGFGNAPAEIEEMLSRTGFSIKWPDASHIVATRAS